MTINTVGNGANDFQAALGIDPAAAKSTATDRQTLGQDAFLKLMLTQLKNQDPLKPLESSQFLAQLAQFSTVSGIQGLQSSFKDLSGSLVSNQALQASALLGRSVLVNRSDGVLSSGGQLVAAVDVPASTPAVVIDVKDKSGQLVQQLGLGAQAKGLAYFAWDGSLADGTKAPPGVYSLSAQVQGGSGAGTAAAVLVNARVDSVTIGAGQSGLTLSLEGLGDVAFSDVRQIN
jgi:flagellar basal-body rod modification protein FlgD